MADAFLFDTTVTSALLSERHRFNASTKVFIDRLSAAGDHIVLSSIALAEHESGFAQAATTGQPVSDELVARIRTYFGSFDIYDFSVDTIEPYALVRAELFSRHAKRNGLKFKDKRPEELRLSGVQLGIEEKDLMIVATAIQYDMVFATHDDAAGMSAIIDCAAALAAAGKPTRLRHQLVPHS